jgi:transposase
MPIPLRSDYDAKRVRAAARESRTPIRCADCWRLRRSMTGRRVPRRRRFGGVTRQIIRDWVLKVNMDGPNGLIDRKAPGQPSRLNETHRTALAAAIESGPIPAVHGVVRWRIVDLCQWLWDEFRVSVSKQTLGRELRAMRYRKLSARPRHHGQAEGAVEAFKKTSPRRWQISLASRASMSPR